MTLTLFILKVMIARCRHAPILPARFSRCNSVIPHSAFSILIGHGLVHEPGVHLRARPRAEVCPWHCRLLSDGRMVRPRGASHASARGKRTPTRTATVSVRACAHGPHAQARRAAGAGVGSPPAAEGRSLNSLCLEGRTWGRGNNGKARTHFQGTEAPWRPMCPRPRIDSSGDRSVRRACRHRPLGGAVAHGRWAPANAPVLSLSRGDPCSDASLSPTPFLCFREERTTARSSGGGATR